MDDDVPMGEGTPKWKPEEFWLRCVSGTTSTILLEIYRASCETDERFVWEVLMEGFLTVGNEGKQELVETEIKYVLENPNPGHRCWSVLETQISEELYKEEEAQNRLIEEQRDLHIRLRLPGKLPEFPEFKYQSPWPLVCLFKLFSPKFHRFSSRSLLVLYKRPWLSPIVVRNHIASLVSFLVDMGSVTQMKENLCYPVENILALLGTYSSLLGPNTSLMRSLIHATAPTCLELLKKLNSFAEVNPPGRLLPTPQRFYSLQNSFGNYLVYLARGGTEVSDDLTNYNFIEHVLPFTKTPDKEYADGAWKHISIALNPDSQKELFVKLGGIELLMTELRRQSIASSNIVFCVRKLAMIPAARHLLISEGVIDIICKLTNEFITDREFFAVALTLSFLVIGMNECDHCAQEIKKTSALSTIVTETLKMEQFTFQNNYVMWTQTRTHSTLLSSWILEVQIFAAWFVLHLMIGQLKKYYARNYFEYVLRDGTANLMVQLFKDLTKESVNSQPSTTASFSTTFSSSSSSTSTSVLPPSPCSILTKNSSEISLVGKRLLLFKYLINSFLLFSKVHGDHYNPLSTKGKGKDRARAGGVGAAGTVGGAGGVVGGANLKVACLEWGLYDRLIQMEKKRREVTIELRNRLIFYEKMGKDLLEEKNKKGKKEDQQQDDKSKIETKIFEAITNQQVLQEKDISSHSSPLPESLIILFAYHSLQRQILVNLFKNPSQNFHGRPFSLKQLCENFLMKNASASSWGHLLCFADSNGFHRLKLFFIGKILARKKRIAQKFELEQLEISLKSQQPSEPLAQTDEDTMDIDSLEEVEAEGEEEDEEGEEEEGEGEGEEEEEEDSTEPAKGATNPLKPILYPTKDDFIASEELEDSEDSEEDFMPPVDSSVHQEIELLEQLVQESQGEDLNIL